jgi:hypothetical protein
MGEVGGELVPLLNYLMPGLLAAWLFYGLTPHQKPAQFERVVQALIFTFLVRCFIDAAKIVSGAYSSFITNNAVILSAMAAILVGFIASCLANSDIFYATFRRMGITRETSYPSEWFGALSNQKGYITLQLASIIHRAE